MQVLRGDSPEHDLSRRSRALGHKEFVVGLVVSLALYAVSQSNYLLFHSLVEGFSAVIGCSLFLLTWNARHWLKADFFLVLGLGALMAALLDGLHLLAYPGMGVFSNRRNDLGTALWLAARLVQALSFLIAPYFLRRRLSLSWAWTLSLGLVGGLVWSIFWGRFPVCYVEGQGLTAFKIASEALIVLLLGSASWAFLRGRDAVSPVVFRLVLSALILSIFSELAFTLYANPFSWENILGHWFKVIAVYLIYKAVIQIGLVYPYELLFRELAHSERQLEAKVQERTAELSVANRQLEDEVTSRRRSEQALAKRVQELRCIFDLGRLTGGSLPPQGELLQQAAALLPQGFQRPDRLCVLIEFREERVELGRLEDCAAVLQIPLNLEGEAPGRLAVGVLEAAEDDAFLPEEKNLLEMFGARLQSALKRGVVEESLRRSESQYRLLATNTRDVIWVLDPELRFVYVNPAIETLTGYRVEEWIGSCLQDHLPSEERSPLLARIHELIVDTSGPGSIVTEATWVARSGEWVPVEMRVTAVLGSNGRVESLQGRAFDIRSRKAAEEERAALEFQLRQSQKMESLGRLAGGMAHDFNNMLAVIVGSAEWLLDQLPEGAPWRAEVSEILLAGQRSADLTRRLLAFARKQPATPETLDFNEAVADLLPMVRRLLGQDMRLQWAPTETPVAVKFDRSQLTQVLMNLAVNARDAMKHSGVLELETSTREFDERDCRLHPQFQPGAYVVLSVRDHGSGIPSEILPQIFEPFFTTKPLGEGTGLGLPTVHGIVRQNQGFIEVESEVGKGTTFRIFLPAVRSEAPHAAVPLLAPDRPELGEGVILLVEDEESLLRLTTRLLEKMGYSVLACLDGPSALEVFREHSQRIDLLISDVVMPSMNGQTLYGRLKEIREDLPCLFMSGYTSDVIGSDGLLDDDIHFLQKPFAFRDLSQRVRALMPRRDSAS